MRRGGNTIDFETRSFWGPLFKKPYRSLERSLLECTWTLTSHSKVVTFLSSIENRIKRRSDGKIVGENTDVTGGRFGTPILIDGLNYTSPWYINY